MDYAQEKAFAELFDKDPDGRSFEGLTLAVNDWIRVNPYSAMRLRFIQRFGRDEFQIKQVIDGALELHGLPDDRFHSRIFSKIRAPNQQDKPQPFAPIDERLIVEYFEYSKELLSQFLGEKTLRNALRALAAINALKKELEKVL